MAMIATIVGGVFERFPKLSIAYLESGIGWVPYMMDRLDEEVEKRGGDEAPYLTKLPSEYVKSGRIYFGVECEEKTIPRCHALGLGGHDPLFVRLPALGRRLAAYRERHPQAHRSVLTTSKRKCCMTTSRGFTAWKWRCNTGVAHHEDAKSTKVGNYSPKPSRSSCFRGVIGSV